MADSTATLRFPQGPISEFRDGFGYVTLEWQQWFQNPEFVTVFIGTGVTVPEGGTGATSFTAHGILIGEGTNPITATAAMTNGQLLVGQTTADPLPKTISGDWTLAASGAATLATVNSNVGTFGSASQVGVFTVNAKGLITAASNATITATATVITVANEATDTTCFPVFVTAATGDLGPKSNANLTFNSNTGVLGAGGLVLTGDLQVDGNSTLGNAAGDTVTVTGTPAGQVIGSTYTPTASASSNLDATPTPQQAQYLRVGATSTVSGTFTADPTAPGAASFKLSLPVASNIGATEDCAGVAFAGGIAGQGAAITGSVANNTAVVSWIAVDITSQSWSYTFSYQII